MQKEEPRDRQERRQARSERTRRAQENRKLQARSFKTYYGMHKVETEVSDEKKCLNI